MRILAIHTANNPDQNKRSAVDTWRIKRPMRELRKHTDWTIDERPTVIPDIDKYTSPDEFTESEMEAAFADICTYDIVFSAYQANPTIFTLLQVANKRAGTQYVMDVDDDMFAINPDNPVWMNITDKQADFMQRMIRSNPWINTTTPELAEVFRERRAGHSPRSVNVISNYIPDDYKQYDPDNGDKVVIGFFGGSSHYGDIHRTGVLEAVQRVMHEHKNVLFKSVGMPIDTYLPKARVVIGDAKRGDPWVNEIFPSLNMDIALGPLEDNLFNAAKSNIKWQEASRAGAAFVASAIGPYKQLKPGTALTVPNDTEEWYRALKGLVESQVRRKALVSKARQELNAYRLEDHWQEYKRLFETVQRAGKPLAETVLQSK